MKKFITLIAAVSCVALFAMISNTGAQDNSAEPKAVQQWEYALAKWDGPDKLEYYYPDHFEFTRMEQQGFKVPKNGEDEQFYITKAANKMAKEGWEAVNLDSRRILFRRPAK